jgi:hypothetical protein
MLKNETRGASGGSKHIDLHFKFVREQYTHKEVAIHFVPTFKLADVWTESTGTCVLAMYACIGGLQHSKPPTQL